MSFDSLAPARFAPLGSTSVCSSSKAPAFPVVVNPVLVAFSRNFGPVLMAYQRIATHPSIFANPMSLEMAWGNILQLINLPRARVIQETETFAFDFAEISKSAGVYGNLVPDTHIATILRQHGVRRIYTANTDFRKFGFLEVINPLG